MSSADTRILIGGRPTGRRHTQIIFGTVSSEQPPPGSFTSAMFVVIPTISSDLSYQFGHWPKCHGNTLPQAGTTVVLGQDERGVLHVLSWDGPNT